MVGYRLSYGQSDVAEKNWIPFTYQNLGEKKGVMIRHQLIE
jgi:hypothetical protein